MECKMWRLVLLYMVYNGPRRENGLMKKTHKNMTLGMSLGMCFGVAIGTAMGESWFGNSGTGLAVGLPVCMCIGMALGTAKDNAVNRQLEEQGYTIKDIRPSEDGKELCVLIVNNRGEEQTVAVSKGELEAETLSVGDVVYLDEDGSLEQAYNDEDE